MKVTVITKVYKVLKNNKKAMRMSEICKALESEHSAAAIRGIIYRHLKKTSNSMIKQVSKGLYIAVEAVKDIKEKVELKIETNVVSFTKHLESKNKINLFKESFLGKVVGMDAPISSFKQDNIIDFSDRVNQKSLFSYEGDLKDKSGVSFVNAIGGNSRYEREENDFYATNPDTVREFLKEFHKDNKLQGSILECACGQGHMAETIKEAYPQNEIVATDLVDRGYGQGGIDFLKHNFRRTFDTIITNPPFKFITEFIKKGLEISNKFVIMLGRIQILEGSKRKEFLQNSPLKYVYVHSKRQATWKNGESTDPKGKPWSSAMCLAWFVWDKEYKGEPIIRWI